MNRTFVPLAAAVTVLIGLVVVFGRPAPKPAAPAGQQILRLGYFPNVTHAPAVVGMARGEFGKAVGPNVSIDAKAFNAGPEEMEALMAGAIDVAYVGPGPAINAFYRSQGRALTVLAGACSGGASLLARPQSGINGIKDLSGKRVAVPQLGGTQDISLRHFLKANGLEPREKGGTVNILPIKNPDILALFLKGQLDAAWVPEPWATRLKDEAGARLVVDERDLWPDKKFTTTVIVARKAYLDKHPEQIEGILRAHLASIDWLQSHADEGQKILNSELKRLTGKQLKPEELAQAWTRLSFTSDANRASIAAFVAATSEAGSLAGVINIDELLDAKPLEKAQRSSPVASR